MNLATTKADRDGVLTWVIAEEGVSINKGDVIARIADLHTFRVDATVSDVHAKRLIQGLPVRVKIGEEYLTANLTNILPTVQNGVITCTVSLDDKRNKLLRSNMRVDVLLITDHKENVLRIKKGPFINGDGEQEVFVVSGDTAVKTKASIGLSGFDHYEVNGLEEGDEVIISDMKDYAHLREVKVN